VVITREISRVTFIDTLVPLARLEISQALLGGSVNHFFVGSPV
jgi:hypothetical protein